MLRSLAVVLLSVVTVACASQGSHSVRIGPKVVPQRVTEHRGSDELLTAGLGLAGLRDKTPPAFADDANPTASELRRRAIWTSWRGIADLSASGGYGDVYGNVTAVPGVELSALVTVPGASQPHRVLVQIPDGYNLQKRCLIVAPSSGSRGIYGAIAVAGAWGLPHGCAVAYTDKGAGSDYFDLDSDTGVRLDGTRARRGEVLAFAPATIAEAHGIAVKHAHSRDNPEGAWGTHVLQAVEFALSALDATFPMAAPFELASTRVIAVGISNGGGAVLRAAEVSGDWLDAVVAGEPNIYVDGARPFYDYASEAALLMPCALLHFPEATVPRGPFGSVWTTRCASLKTAGRVAGDDVTAQANAAYDTLKAHGWTDAALLAGATTTAFDLWRAVLVTYASAYSRAGVGEHPCDYAFSALSESAAPRRSSDAERAAWFSDASGIPPGTGVAIVDSKTAAPDATFPGLACLRELEETQKVAAGVNETRSAAPRVGLPLVIVHGTSDGLIPEAFSSVPYVASAKAAGRSITHWQIENAQHFDAFLALPGFADRYVPLLPYVYAALDATWANLESGTPLPPSAVISAKPRGTEPLTADQLAVPRASLQ